MHSTLLIKLDVFLKLTFVSLGIYALDLGAGSGIRTPNKQVISPLFTFSPQLLSLFFRLHFGKNIGTSFLYPMYFWQASERSAGFLKEACSPIREKRCCEGYWGLFLGLGWLIFLFCFRCLSYNVCRCCSIACRWRISDFFLLCRVVTWRGISKRAQFRLRTISPRMQSRLKSQLRDWSFL